MVVFFWERVLGTWVMRVACIYMGFSFAGYCYLRISGVFFSSFRSGLLSFERHV